MSRSAKYRVSGSGLDGDEGCCSRAGNAFNQRCAPQNGMWMGRSGSGWAWLGLFYTVYYIVLIGMCAVMMVGLMYSLPTHRPRYTLGQDLYEGTAPGLGVIPKYFTGRTLMFTAGFDANDPASYEGHIKQMNAFLEDYDGVTTSDVRTDCSDENAPNKTCNVDTTSLGPCDGSSDTSFGYSSGEPCFLLKVNNIYDWLPEPYPNVNDSQAVKPTSTDIGVSCIEDPAKGATSVLASGAFKLYPESGFPFTCYPFCGKPYMHPLVMVKITVPKGTTATIWCKAWAKNILHNRNDRAGSVRFQVQSL